MSTIRATPFLSTQGGVSNGANDWPLLGWRATAGTHDTADRRRPAAACFPSKRLLAGRVIPPGSCGRAIAALPESGPIPLRVPSAPPLSTSDGTAAGATAQLPGKAYPPAGKRRDSSHG